MKKALAAVVVIIVIIAIAVGLSHNSKSNGSNSSQTTYKKYSGTITGAGSTFGAPLYGQLGSQYKNLTGTTLNFQADGSGAGVAQFIARTVNFGATDVALTDSEVSQAQANGTPLNIPTTFGAVTISYNLPGVKSGLKLDGPTIADIYLGKVTNWSDPAIASLNPGVKLPNLPISPVYRSDGSGTTAIFTQFLTDVNPTWSSQVGSSKTVQWPTGTGASGNTGVAAAVTQTKGAIGYVELAYALKNNFTTAAVKNADGEYVTPTLNSTSLAGQDLPKLPEDLRFTAVNSPSKGAYPIASATFIVVYQDVCKANEVSNRNQAQALQGYLKYIQSSDGEQTMKQLEYAPLPSQLLAKAQAKVDSMACNGQKL